LAIVIGSVFLYSADIVGRCIRNVRCVDVV
jgi:hypothetical protein